MILMRRIMIQRILYMGKTNKQFMGEKVDNKLTSRELKAIVAEYTYDEDERFSDELLPEPKRSDKEWETIRALNKVNKSDFIIYCLYLNYGSARRVGKLLGTSHAPVTRVLRRVEEEIMNEMIKRKEKGLW